ncbi:MAG: D-erythronate dehydrogenase [Alphaproteobacteria bacterium]
MRHVLITGGGGFLGRKLAAALNNHPDVDKITLFDQQPIPSPPSKAETIVGDLLARGMIERIANVEIDTVVHLAAVVSSGAEADFDLGMTVNIDGLRAMLEQLRTLGTCPKVLFTSSVAAFGETPPIVTDDTPTRPQSSYGAQKAIGEYLINDMSRKGFIDGRVMRLPTVVVRPGKPNKAASSFASGILREPLNGEATVCPVRPDLPLWIASPRAVTKALVHALETPTALWNPWRTINLCGITVTVAEMVAALGRVGGDPGLIEWKRDPAIEAIVGTWPGAFETTRANAMGFERDKNIDAILNAYKQDDM